MTKADITQAIKSLPGKPWRLWQTQLRNIVWLENRRNLFSWRSMWVYFLAFAPTCIVLLRALFANHGDESFAESTMIFAGVFQFYYVRIGIFFGTLGIFTRLIRGEMVERSLHYYLLSPVRREVLLLGKFAAGAIRSMLLMESAVLASFLLMYLPCGTAGQRYISDGPGFSQLLAYLGITALACLGYGAIFLLFSMLMKNPVPAALVLMGWEAISTVFPAIAQRLSIASYLRNLMPVSVPAEGVFALLTVTTEPVPAWMSVLGALILTAVVLVISCYRMRSLEISYTTE